MWSLLVIISHGHVISSRIIVPYHHLISSSHITISYQGSTRGVDAVLAKMQGVSSMKLKVANAFHSPLMTCILSGNPASHTAHPSPIQGSFRLLLPFLNVTYSLFYSGMQTMRKRLQEWISVLHQPVSSYRRYAEDSFRTSCATHSTGLITYEVR